MNNLKENNIKRDSIETLLTICIYDTSLESVISFFEERLIKSNNITNPIKKSKIHNRISLFMKYLNDNLLPTSIINSIFLIDDKLIEYKLTTDEILTARKYSLFPIFLKTDIFFHIDYLIDFFTNFEFIYTMKLIKNVLEISTINKTKELIIETKKGVNENDILSSIEFIRSKNKNTIIVYGQFSSSFLSNKKDENLVIIRNETSLSRIDLYDIYLKKEMENNHILLKKRLDDIQNPKTNIDIYLFGKLKKEIKEAVENYSLKELYIETELLEKLKNFFEDDGIFNFKIIPIKVIEEGDIASIFIRDYNGLMGIKYF